MPMPSSPLDQTPCLLANGSDRRSVVGPAIPAAVPSGYYMLPLPPLVPPGQLQAASTSPFRHAMSTGDLIRDRDRDDDREEEEQRVVVAAAAPGRYSAEERRERASTSTGASATSKRRSRSLSFSVCIYIERVCVRFS
jgi:hypothetical protein